MQAIILAAGQGTRLRPLTNDLPKCLVRVGEKPMLQYQLEALSDAGIRDCTIVVGYRGRQVWQTFGRKFRSLSIRYIENDVFDRTNNIYSLWLARSIVTDALLLLEGDLIFEPRLLVDLVSDPRQNVAVVDDFLPSMDGTAIQAEDGAASAVVLKADQSPRFDYLSAFKTVNIYRLSRTAVRAQLMPTIDDFVSRGLTDHFYEVAISRAVAAGSLRLHVMPTEARWWCEIDTEDDLRLAETMLDQSRLSLQRGGLR